MSFKYRFIFPVFFLLLGITSSAQKSVADFRLRSTDNKWVSLKKYQAAKGFIVVFICNHCPFAARYTERLNALNAKYSRLGIPVIAVNSSDTTIFRDESFSNMVAFAKKKKYTFPYLCDKTQGVARNFAANKTPHAFVIWKEHDEWLIKYNGSLDDNGAEPSKVVHGYINEAVDNLLAGKTVTTPVTNSIGCEIHYRYSPMATP